MPIQAEAPQGASVSGIVRTATGEAAHDAEVTLLDAGRLPVATVRAGADGRFTFSDLAPGRYLLLVTAAGAERIERVVQVPPEGIAELIVAAAIEGLTERVTVATPGSTGNRGELAGGQRRRGSLPARQDGAGPGGGRGPGLHLQRTSSTIGAIFVRGFTGAKVNTYVDGVRH